MRAVVSGPPSETSEWGRRKLGRGGSRLFRDRSSNIRPDSRSSGPRYRGFGRWGRVSLGESALSEVHKLGISGRRKCRAEASKLQGKCIANTSCSLPSDEAGPSPCSTYSLCRPAYRLCQISQDPLQMLSPARATRKERRPVSVQGRLVLPTGSVGDCWARIIRLSVATLSCAGCLNSRNLLRRGAAINTPAIRVGDADQHVARRRNAKVASSLRPAILCHTSTSSTTTASSRSTAWSVSVA